MKHEMLEQISSLMDGELGTTQARFAVRQLHPGSAARDHWQRMHLVRSYLRDGHATVVPDSFLDGIQQRLHNEQIEQQPAAQPAASSQRLRNWLKPAAGLAVAASVAVLALTGINHAVLQQQNQNPSQPLATTSAVDPASTATLAATDTASTDNSPVTDFIARQSVLDRSFSAQAVQAVPVNFSDDPEAARQRLNDYLLRHSQLSSGSGHVGFVSYMPLVSSVDLSAAANDPAANDTRAVPATMLDSSEPAAAKR